MHAFVNEDDHLFAFLGRYFVIFEGICSGKPHLGVD